MTDYLSHPAGTPARRPLFSNGVLLFCVLVLVSMVLWQNFGQPVLSPPRHLLTAQFAQVESAGDS